MKSPNLNLLEQEAEKNFKKREKKKRVRMKVSGARAKGLAKIIKEKA